MTPWIFDLDDDVAGQPCPPFPRKDVLSFFFFYFLVLGPWISLASALLGSDSAHRPGLLLMSLPLPVDTDSWIPAYPSPPLPWGGGVLWGNLLVAFFLSLFLTHWTWSLALTDSATSLCCLYVSRLRDRSGTLGVQGSKRVGETCFGHAFEGREANNRLATAIGPGIHPGKVSFLFRLGNGMLAGRPAWASCTRGLVLFSFLFYLRWGGELAFRCVSVSLLELWVGGQCIITTRTCRHTVGWVTGGKGQGLRDGQFVRLRHMP